MDILGIKFVGINADNGQKLLLTLMLLIAVSFFKRLTLWVFDHFYGKIESSRVRFWSKQGVNLFTAFIAVLIILSIWFDDPRRLTTGLGLVTAGLAFALQKVVTAFAGYIIIMRGNTFSVGERITMGGIRGDVISLGFIQTTIMEMGQPPSVKNAAPEIWVNGRQFTGRIVTVTNDKIFENPVYNYTRDFSFIWEEMSVSIRYGDPFDIAESILLQAVKNHTDKFVDVSDEQRKVLAARYGVVTDDIVPRVFLRMTDNWLELSVRFIVPEHGVRVIKDAITRELLAEFARKNIELASTTLELVSVPPLKVDLSGFSHTAKDT